MTKPVEAIKSGNYDDNYAAYTGIDPLKKDKTKGTMHSAFVAYNSNPGGQATAPVLSNGQPNSIMT